MKFFKDNKAAIIFTLLIHAVVIALFAANINFERQKPTTNVKPIQAEAINSKALDEEIERQKRIEQDKLDAEIARQKKLEDEANKAKQEREAEEQRIAKLEQERLAKEEEAKKQAELEKQRKAEVEKQKAKDEEERKKRLAEQKQKEQAEKDRLAKLEEERIAKEAELKKLEEAKKKREAEEAERKKKELEAKQKAEEEAARLQAEIEAEEKRLAEEQARLAEEMEAEAEYQELIGSGALSRYHFAIQQAIVRNWRPPTSGIEDIKCELDVGLLPGGDVVSLEFGECDVSEAVQLSIEQAVFNASPFPEPEDERLFKRSEFLLFAPEL